MEIIRLGGPVLWAIIGCSFVAAVVFIEKGLCVHRARIKDDDFLAGVFNILRRNNVPEALAICEDTPGPVARVVRTAILNREEPRDVVEAAMIDTGVAEIGRLEERLGLLATITQVTPMLGLLGTVIAMMQFLGSLRGADTLVHSADLLSSMWTALITTGAGLTVAIPCYAAYNLIVTNIEAVVVDMERAAAETMIFLRARRAETAREGGEAQGPA